MKKEERIKRTERIIKRRAKIIFYNWDCPTHRYLKELNRLKKYNLACPCKGCRAGDEALAKYKLKKKTQS